MNLLVIFVLLPLVISAQRYRGLSSPNNDPFLPIFPVYPYNPKLIKRGAEKEYTSQLNPELFAPKLNARDSYLNFNGNHRRDPNNISTIQNIYQTAYTSTNQAYSPSPQPYASIPRTNSPNYNSNHYPFALYNGYPVALITQPYSSQIINPNYQQVYYANYNKQAYPIESDKNDSKNFERNPERTRNELSVIKDGFIDGTNYIANLRDTEDANSQYKQNSFSQLQLQPDASELHLRSAQLPATAYQLVGIEGQQNRQSNYALSPITSTSGGYKYQQLDPTMAAALSRLFAQPGYSNVQPTQSTQNQYEVSDYNQNTQVQQPPIQSNPSAVIAKTGLAYVMNQPIHQAAPRHVAKVPEMYQLLDTGIIDRGQKMTQVTVEPSQSVYIPPPMKFTKNIRNYADYNNGYIQQASPYNGAAAYSEAQNIQAAPSQAYTYQYAGYNSTPVGQDQLANYRIPLDNINYASKRNA